MREPSKTMYKIGKIFGFVLLGLSATLAVLHLILMIVYIADNTKGNWQSELSSLIGSLLWLGFVIVVVILAGSMIQKTETDLTDKAPHITMIVFGVFLEMSSTY